MWLGHIPWAGRYWALPFLTALAPSERYYRQRGRTPQKLTGRARQMILQLRRWLPRRPPALVGDSGYAVLDLLHFCPSLPQPVTCIPASPVCVWTRASMNRRRRGQNGRPLSWATRAAHLLQQHHPIIQRATAWYAKPAPTFADAIALVRRHLWTASGGFTVGARR